MLGDSSNTNYLDRDYASIRKSILNYFKSLSAEWTSLNPDTFESHFVDVIAGVADMLSYYIDASLSESNLLTAKQQDSMYNLMRCAGYYIDIAGPAKGSIIFSSSSAPMSTFTIPKYTKFILGNGYTYYSSEEVSFTNNSPAYFEVPVFEGTYHSNTLSFSKLISDYKMLLINDQGNRVDGNIISLKERVLLDTITLSPSETTSSSLTKVDDAFLQTEGGPYFSVYRRAMGDIYLMFTYNWKNYINSDFKLKFYSTKGEEGNYEKGYSVQLGSNIYDENNLNILSVYSMYHSAMTGGYSDIDYRKHAANAVKYMRINDRIVTRADLETFVTSLPGVNSCKVCEWADIRNVTSYENYWEIEYGVPTQSDSVLYHTTNDLYSLSLDPSKVIVYVDSVDGNKFSDAVLKDFSNKVNEKITFTTNVSVVNSVKKTGKIKFKVSLLRSEIYKADDLNMFKSTLTSYLSSKSGYLASLTRTNIDSALAEYKGVTVDYTIDNGPFELTSDSEFYISNSTLTSGGYKGHIWENTQFVPVIELVD